MPNARHRKTTTAGVAAVVAGRPKTAGTAVRWAVLRGGRLRAPIYEGFFWVLLSAPIRAGGRVTRNDLISRKGPRRWDPVSFPSASHVILKRV